MLKTLLSSILSVAVTRLPWELILATLSKFIFGQLQSKQPEQLARGKRYVAKAAEQLALISAAVEDDTLSKDEVDGILTAWAAGEKTPAVAGKIFN
jgi:hypothetical protein